MLFETLALVGSHLNQNNITWAVGASLMLNHYGLVDNPNDIDIIVDPNDIHRALTLLSSLGQLHEYNKHPNYKTTHFHELTVNGVDIDLMSEMKINHSKGTYTYHFTSDAIVNHMVVNQVQIPLTSMEDWYVLYQLIGRAKKVKIIEDYFAVNGIAHPQRLTDVLTDDLPIHIIKKTRSLC